MATEKRIKLEDLKNFCKQALIKEGLNEDDAMITAEVLAETDSFGTASHGTKNLHNYIRKYRAGGMKMNAVQEILKEGPAYALVDSHDMIGMASAYKGMQLAIEKAAQTGISCVLVKNSMHFGAAGYYANMAAKKNMIGFVYSNVDSNMTAPGARAQIIGNSPFSYAAPAGEFKSVFLDIAMSSVASMKVIQARKDGVSVPDGWIVDRDGLPTNDPSKYPEEAAMQPMAGHKGYGLAVMVEMITGVLSGGGVMQDIPSWIFQMEKRNDVSHLFIVLDISKFMPVDQFVGRMESMVNYLHSAPKAKGFDRIYYPGEIEWSKKDAESNVVLLSPATVESLEGLSEESKIPLKWL
jgi:LDH2 family malate/lactate/ureidoglycolate dehydrogenase